MLKEFSSGAIFLFVSRDRKTVKAMKWDGTGAVCFQKKMEKGRITSFPAVDGDSHEISAEELMGIISGGKVRLDLKI